RLIHKLKGHERVSSLMEEGTLLDDASNHSRYVLQAPGVLYHARSHGRTNEKPPEPVFNVLINENLIQHGEAVVIDPQIRARTEPKVPLRLLWITDSLDPGDGEMLQYFLIRQFTSASKHKITVASSNDGATCNLYEGIASVEVAAGESLLRRIEEL